MIRKLFAWIAWRFAGVTIGLLRWAKRVIKSNPALYAFANSLRNSQEFSNLFEHEKMLADPVRVDTYAQAIRKAVKPGDVVVDLGTGSGVLAMLAARQGAKVYAIDHSDFIHLAEENARRNKIDGIRFIRANSKNFAPPEKADLLLHEQIGDNLFDENMVENLLDLKRRILKPGGKILPGRFHLYLEPVALKREYQVPYLEEIQVHGLDFTYLAQAGRHFRAADYDRRRVERDGVEYFLGKPQPVLTVDLNEIDSGSDLPSVINVTRRVTQAGQLDAIQQFFAVDFDEETYFDTSPFSRRTHWTNRVWRVPTRRYEIGETIDYSVSLTDLSVASSWKINLLPETQPRPSLEPVRLQEAI